MALVNKPLQCLVEMLATQLAWHDSESATKMSPTHENICTTICQTVKCVVQYVAKVCTPQIKKTDSAHSL